MIPEKLLLQHGGILRKYKKNQSIFFEGSMPKFYYQVKTGAVKMFSYNETGKQFIQGIFTSGQSFGEPVLLIERPYPANAVANEDSELVMIRKEEFIKILIEFPGIHYDFTRNMAKRIYQKTLLAKAISLNGTENRVLSVLKLLKDDDSKENLNGYQVQLSRQQIADMIGFRVETVIRAIRNLQKKNVIKIQKGKVYI